MKLILLLFLLIIGAGHDRIDETSAKPNIILIYADDLGIGLLGHKGQNIITTPNIDKLAEEGLQFHNAYSNMLCAPARASLLTGLHDCHKNGFEITNGGAYFNTEKSNLAEIDNILDEALSPVANDQVFLGEIAKAMGYKTIQIGKLGWGFSSTHGQLKRHGWDQYFGYLDHERAHGFYPPFLFENGDYIAIEGNSLLNCGKSGEPETNKNFKERWNMEGKAAYSQDIFMNYILTFLDNNKDHPFFLYFPTQLPHGPVSIPVVHEDFVNDERLTQIEKEYASMVKLLDDNVGQMVKRLKDLNIDQNTIIIFTSDNGHEIYYSQEGRILKPYTHMKSGKRFDGYKNKYYSALGGDVFDGNGNRAGLKRSNLQGGINVPLIIKWPKRIRKGRNSNHLVANYDILPTIADITGYSKTLHSDGISFYNELNAIPNKEHEFIVYSSFSGPALVDKQGWKIRSHVKQGVFELYYLPEDFREENDLSLQYPAKLKELENKLVKACDGNLNHGLYSNQNNIALE